MIYEVLSFPRARSELEGGFWGSPQVASTLPRPQRLLSLSPGCKGPVLLLRLRTGQVSLGDKTRDVQKAQGEFKEKHLLGWRGTTFGGCFDGAGGGTC